MATPGELVDTMAEVLGLPIATVTQYDRQLAENSLRSRGGRSRGPAQKVTPRDAANLLISIMASPCRRAVGQSGSRYLSERTGPCSNGAGPAEGKALASLA